MLSRGGSVQPIFPFCIFVRNGVSVIARMAIWRVDYGVIKGFFGSAKPAMFSIYHQFQDRKLNNNILYPFIYFELWFDQTWQPGKNELVKTSQLSVKTEIDYIGIVIKVFRIRSGLNAIFVFTKQPLEP